MLSVADLLALDAPAPEMLIESMVPMRGASLTVGASKTGKTILMVQAAIAVASRTPLFGLYAVNNPGPALIVEQDDPAGAASIKEILRRSPVPVSGIPLYLVPRVPFTFGPNFLTWLEGQISERGLRFVVLDSYTALRGPRRASTDIVKAEQSDLTLLDALAKKMGCAIVIIHHASKGSASLDWSEKAAGTFAMSAATEGQIHVARFPELDGAAPERLVRVRGRHSADMEMLLRFRKESLDFEHVMEGGPAALYPLLREIQAAFGTEPFGPKELSYATGASRATASRQITRLYHSEALIKRGFGQYVLAVQCDRWER